MRSALEGSGLEVCAECADAAAAVATALRERPEVCLIDARLPGGGIEAVRTITSEVPETQVVVLAESPDRELFLDAMESGAIGFLLADMNPDRLAFALRDVVAGKAAVPRSLVMPILEGLSESAERTLARR